MPAVVAGVVAMEVKLGGFRCLAFHGPRWVRSQSRAGRDLTGFFPEIAAAVASQLPVGCVIDGELVADRDGRLDFTVLQRRLCAPGRRAHDLARTRPVTLVGFDVLCRAGQDLRGRSYRHRRAALENLLADVRPPLQLIPMTTDPAVAAGWYTDHAPGTGGVEGLVFKGVDDVYRGGVRRWQKLRYRWTETVVVGAVLGPLTAPTALVVGRPGRGDRLQVAGITGRLAAAQQAELAGLLQPGAGDHPWPDVLPGGWLQHRGGGAPPKWTRVSPTVLAEVVVDNAFDRGRWRHPLVVHRIHRGWDARVDQLT